MSDCLLKISKRLSSFSPESQRIKIHSIIYCFSYYKDYSFRQKSIENRKEGITQIEKRKKAGPKPDKRK